MGYMVNIETLKINAESARAAYRNGMVTKDEAQKMVEPYANAFNEKSQELAKKYNQKPKLFSFAAYMR